MKPFLSGFVMALAIGVYGLAPLFEEHVEQPIQFNHQAHQEDLECTACHASVLSQSFAGLPTLEVCMLCHETALTESPEEEKIRTLAGEGAPVQWNRLFKQPTHVFYSHRRHVQMAGLACQTCHGDIGQSTTPPEQVENLSMDECIFCHEENGVRNNCVDCHR